MMMKKSIFLLIILLALPVTAAFAREVRLAVVDGDLQIPLEGALIIQENGTETECDGEGIVWLSVSSNAPERIIITYPGYSSLRFLITETRNDFIARLYLSGGDLPENKELIFTVERNPLLGVELGRGVALPREQLDLASEIGLVEDIMSSVKLLPGVGYAGFFNAQPSIRGGEPGDLTAVLDGFYIGNPYHWGGAYSIFDPKMVESAKLSHGVFSAKYSHTISGILDVASKKTSNQYTEAEISVSTSAFNIALSVPLAYNAANPSLGGGISFSGKMSYWDPYVAFTKELSKFASVLEPVNAVTTAPYIRSGAVSVNYRWNNYLACFLNGYFGSDGVGVKYSSNDAVAQFIGDSSELRFNWDNMIGFISGSLLYNPKEDMIVRGMLGANAYNMDYKYYEMRTIPNVVSTILRDDYTTTQYSAQGRGELDWELNPAFLLSFGIEELFKQWNERYDSNTKIDMEVSPGTYDTLNVYTPNVTNNAFSSSGWGILTWNSPKKIYSVEAGLRLDHIYFFNTAQSVGSVPVLNPRINFDFYPPYSNKYLENISFTAGTGLFSTINGALSSIDENTGLEELKQARSWTSITGVKFNFFNGYGLSLETYYKYGFDRAYYRIEDIDNRAAMVYFFDGVSHIAGFELMLQRFSGKKLNGWLSYSFNLARYKDPKGTRAFLDADFQNGRSVWYYPQFHRFHTINLVVNYRFNNYFNLYTRYGFASGVPEANRVAIRYDNSNNAGPRWKYKNASTYSDDKRNAWTMPLDIKLSYYLYNKYGKTQGEVYCAIENTLVLVLPKEENSVLNIYTGAWEEGGANVGYALPIPMVSFGFKWSY
jgi:hypothetical protein